MTHLNLKLCAGLARSTTLEADLVSNERGSWPEITFLRWSKTSSTVVEITQHAHKDGHASIGLKLMVCCGLDQSQHMPGKSPSPPCHTAAVSLPGFSDSNTHNAPVFAVTSCGRNKKIPPLNVSWHRRCETPMFHTTRPFPLVCLSYALRVAAPSCTLRAAQPPAWAILYCLCSLTQLIESVIFLARARGNPRLVDNLRQSIRKVSARPHSLTQAHNQQNSFVGNRIEPFQIVDFAPNFPDGNFWCAWDSSSAFWFWLLR